jgi:uncharacterized protein (UPF0332 family)
MLDKGASEYAIRNALSRAYYGLFHACRGYLCAREELNIEALGKKHPSLHSEMARPMGRPFRQFLTRSWNLRCTSDYEPEWRALPEHWYLRQLKEARGQYFFVVREAEKLMSQARGRG